MTERIVEGSTRQRDMRYHSVEGGGTPGRQELRRGGEVSSRGAAEWASASAGGSQQRGAAISEPATRQGDLQSVQPLRLS